jgi:hypothetical protein
MQNGIEGNHNIHLKHQPIGMDVQSNLDTMNHNLTFALNSHTKLMWQEMQKNHII